MMAKKTKVSAKATKAKVKRSAKASKSKADESAPKLPGKLIMFYGKECPYCVEMMPLVDQLEKESGVKVTRLEVWHDKKNEKVMMRFAAQLKLAGGGNLGVPSFYNAKTKEAICGEQSYENLRSWAAVR
jgi:thiol-disulfide isomerase/thioredoxin